MDSIKRLGYINIAGSGNIKYQKSINKLNKISIIFI